MSADPLTHGSAAAPLRFGLVGTGHWARFAHARALASVPGITFTAVWGRNVEAAAGLAADFGVTGHADFGGFLADVDAVAFSVPPDVQSELATRAARAGKHLLLEKPVALTEPAADALVSAADGARVASVVFFTSRFQPDSRAWLSDVAGAGGWIGGSALWLATGHTPGSPFDTPWRRAKGGLWDLGPHVVSLMWAIFGPVESVTADAGRGDLTHLVLHHQGGATTTATLTLGAPEAADGFSLQIWGDRGRSSIPQLADDPVVALRLALTELAGNARSGAISHPCDARFGRDVVRVLACAQAQLDGNLTDAARIMHGALSTDAGYTIMGADILSDMDYEPNRGTSVSVSGDDAEQLRRYWVELSAGGSISVPLASQPWGDEFGMCTDRFGVPWMIDIVQPQG